MFGFFDAKPAEEFGQTMAKFFMEIMPPNAIIKGNKSLEKKFANVDRMYLQIEKFKAGHKMNLYKKGKFLTAFKLHLLSAGYEEEFVERVTKGVSVENMMFREKQLKEYS